MHRDLLGYYNLCAMMIGLIANIFETSKCLFQSTYYVISHYVIRLKLVYNEDAKGVTVALCSLTVAVDIRFSC